MIASILGFSIKSIICSGVFGAYYLLALKNAQSNSFNRVYLLAAALLSVVLPFVSFELLHVSSNAVPDFPLLQISAEGSKLSAADAAGPAMVDWSSVLATGYIAVTALMISALAIKSAGYYLIKGNARQERGDGFVLVRTEDPRAPFSFMNRLYWPTDMPQDSPEGKSILMHELAHIRQYHTLDKILMQLILAVCWLNPFNWLIKKELWLQHEFLADKYAIGDRDSEAFARMLLYSVSTPSNTTIISPFFQSAVERRLLMLRQPARNAYGLLRRFMSIPVLLLALALLSADTKQSGSVIRSAKKIVLVLDVAHGGEDAGGESIYGQLEKDITLALSRKLVALSPEYNIEITTTRDADVAASLEERLQKAHNSQAAAFISVHLRKGEANDGRGNSYELGLNPKSGNYRKSLLLGSAIAARLRAQELPAAVVDYSNAYVIRNNKLPALLIEFGNLDDADNMARLSDEAQTETLCRNVLNGVVAYSTKLDADETEAGNRK
jgi:N-acetylmuramoyl-L-alanine amidase